MSGDQEARTLRGTQAPEQSKRLKRAVTLGVLILLSVIILAMAWTIVALRQTVKLYEDVLERSNRTSTISGATGDVEPLPRIHADADQIKAFLADCEKGINGWQTAEVDYPKLLSMHKSEARAYVTKVILRNGALPPDTTIRGATPQDPPIEVQCIMSARLAPVGKSLVIEYDNHSALREFTSTGIVDWSWTITALKPGDHEVRLELQPTVATQVSRTGLLAPVEGSSSLNATTYISSVHVDATWVQHVGQWWDDNFKILQTVVVSVASTIAVVVISFVTWTGKLGRTVRQALAEWRDKEKQDEQKDRD